MTRPIAGAVIVAVLLAGCANNVSEERALDAIELCRDHGGLYDVGWQFAGSAVGILQVDCRDGVSLAMKRDGTVRP